MKLFNEDCLLTAERIKKETVDLIYLDPPFFTQNKMSSSNGDYSFNDKWNSMENYLIYIKTRLIKLKTLLKPTGSIFLHCDRNASHYLKMVLDEVFGIDNFQSEIIWAYKRWSNSKKGLLNSHQTIFFYSKTKQFKFNEILVDYSSTTNLDQILQLRKRHVDGRCVYLESSDKQRKINKKGVPLSDVWEIPFLNPKAKERVNYPTQKPIELIDRILDLVTDEGDLVYDPFCGSGTTLVSAKIKNREYIGSDISEDAIHLALERLKRPIKTKSFLLEKGYDSYKNQDKFKLDVLKRYGAKVVQRNKSIDGLISSDEHGAIPVKIITDVVNIESEKEKLIRATLKKKIYNCLLIITDTRRNGGESFQEYESRGDLKVYYHYDIKHLGM